MTAATSKAAGFNTTAKVIRRLLGDRFETFMQALPLETQWLLRRQPPAVAWIPLEHFVTLIERAGEALGGLARVEEIGRLSIAEDLNTLYRVFIRLATPQYVLARVAKLFATYNQNNGTLTARHLSETSVELVYAGLQCNTTSYWAYSRGAIWAVVSLLGLRDAAVTSIPPQQNEDAVFRVSWS